MQERHCALAVCMCLSTQPRQVPAQLVVQALNVVRMRLTSRVLAALDDGFVGLVVIGAVLNVRRLRQLGLQHFGGCRTSVTESKTHNLVAMPVYCPPQPDGLFFVPMKLHISSISTTVRSWAGTGLSALA